MFHRNTAVGRLSLHQSDGYGKARKAARCTETLNVRETLPVKECSDETLTECCCGERGCVGGGIPAARIATNHTAAR